MIVPFASRLRLSLTRGVLFALGVLLPLSAVALFFIVPEFWRVAIRTMFEYPPNVLAQKTDGYGMLLQGLKWFALAAGPLMAAGFAGLTITIRKERSAFGMGLVAWLSLLAERYRCVRESVNGTWYEMSDVSDAAAVGTRTQLPN